MPSLNGDLPGTNKVTRGTKQEQCGNHINIVKYLHRAKPAKLVTERGEPGQLKRARRAPGQARDAHFKCVTVHPAREE